MFSSPMSSSSKAAPKHFKMYSFSDKRQRLTRVQIHSILKRCSQCYRLSNSAKNIFSYEDLPAFTFGQLRKTIFFINANEHWILVAVFAGRQCLIVDPLDIVKTWPDVIRSITLFCQNNSLQLFYFDFRFQRDNTQICGYLCLWMTAKISQLSFLNVLRLKSTLSQHRISTNERGMMYSVHKHFHLE